MCGSKSGSEYVYTIDKSAHIHKRRRFAQIWSPRNLRNLWHKQGRAQIHTHTHSKTVYGQHTYTHMCLCGFPGEAFVREMLAPCRAPSPRIVIKFTYTHLLSPGCRRRRPKDIKCECAPPARTQHRPRRRRRRRRRSNVCIG